MKVLSGAPGNWSIAAPTATAVGVFDGMHVGHHAVVRATLDDDALVPAVLTFSTHPAAVLAPDGPPPQLGTLEQRLEQLEAAGVRVVALVEFDEELRMLAPAEFVDRYLIAGLDVGRVAVGSDFRFGHRAAGTVETLEDLGTDRGFDVRSIPPVVVDGGEVRSSRIRELIGEGDVSRAAVLLGRPYAVRGSVVRGAGRGRAIGIPTANLAVSPSVALPATGVYAVRVSVGDEWRDGVANLGRRPTFEGSDLTLEAHLMDTERDLYGLEIDVAFVDRLRGERKFDTVDALVRQIRADIEAGRGRLTRTP